MQFTPYSFIVRTLDAKQRSEELVRSFWAHYIDWKDSASLEDLETLQAALDLLGTTPVTGITSIVRTALADPAKRSILPATLVEALVSARWSGVPPSMLRVAGKPTPVQR